MLTIALLSLLAIVLAIALVVMGLHWLELSDPYIRTVISLDGNPEQGHAIFQINCAGCHGLNADGRVGPSLLGVSARKTEAGIIQQVIGGKTPPMPKFQPTPQAMADLLSYLQSL